MATADNSKSGFSLGKMFNKVVREGLKLATIGVVAAVAWQVVLDPIFFPILHDAMNLTAQAWVNFIHTNFSFIPEFLGLTGDWGLMQTDLAQNILAPYYPQPPDPMSAAITGF